MGGKINAYYDFVSPYSYFAFVHLQRVRSALASHGVTVEIHPVFLGGIMSGSGNKPPWTVGAKSTYGTIELRRTIRYFGLAPFQPPSFWPLLTVLPLRAITYIKHAYPDKYEQVFGLYWHWLFYEHRDLSKLDVLQAALQSDGLFSAAQVREILTAAGEQKWKDALVAKTKEALDKGAFGAPFFSVLRTSASGEVEEETTFWGSDRFHYIWDFLGLPWDDFKLHANEAKL